MTRRRYMTRRGKHVPLRGGHVTRGSRERSVLPDDLATRKNDSLLGTQRSLPEKGNLFGSEKLGSYDTELLGKPRKRSRTADDLKGYDLGFI